MYWYKHCWSEPLVFRGQLSLREKHAKHLSDLRSYYEAEIQELRQKLIAAADGPGQATSAPAAARQSARERILEEENTSLRQQLRQVQDVLDDSQM